MARHAFRTTFARMQFAHLSLHERGFLFSTSQAGATATGRLFSLAETAKANGIEPHAYFTHLFTHLPATETLEDFKALLPWSLKGLPTLRSR